MRSLSSVSLLNEESTMYTTIDIHMVSLLN